MLIGAMNHPGRDLIEEIRLIADLGLDFVDLTLEPPAGLTSRIRPAEIREALQKYHLPVVGHTAYYLPLASPFPSLREAAVHELNNCVEAFAAIGARFMNIHPDGHAPFESDDCIIARNLESIGKVSQQARKAKIELMIENLPGKFNSVAQLSPLLEAMPDLFLHLDIGHSNLLVEQNTAGELIVQYRDRIRHVHLHDNKGGGADLHLPLGAGTIDIAGSIQLLQESGYDSTITLEVFSPDKHYLRYSRDLLRRLWDEGARTLPRFKETSEKSADLRTPAKRNSS